ncbi:MAG: carotenoid oxygenase family protein, partial [Acidimicrobiia bacterium]
GIVKYDMESGSYQRYDFGPGRFGSEAPFAARSDKAEDDGYLISFVANHEDGHSECVIIDAPSMTEVGRVQIPQRVPHGFHACWVDQEQLEARRT